MALRRPMGARPPGRALIAVTPRCCCPGFQAGVPCFGYRQLFTLGRASTLSRLSAPLKPPEVLEAQESRRVRNLPLGIAREDAVVPDLKSRGPVALELIVEAQRNLEPRRGLGVAPRQM